MCTCRFHRLRRSLGSRSEEATTPAWPASGRSVGATGSPTAGSVAATLWAAPSLAAAKLYGTAVQYDFVSSGVVKGSQTTVRLPDGSLDVRFEFTDRGRGPKTAQRNRSR